MLTEPTNTISPGQQGRQKKNRAGFVRAGAVTFKQLCVALKLNHHEGPNFPPGLLGHWVLSYHIRALTVPGGAGDGYLFSGL